MHDIKERAMFLGSINQITAQSWPDRGEPCLGDLQADDALDGAQAARIRLEIANRLKRIRPRRVETQHRPATMTVATLNINANVMEIEV